MRLFDIFRKKSRQPTDGSTVLFFHEDDYCQIELSPVENTSLFLNEFEKINDLAAESFDGSGYTDIHVRKGQRVELEERKINPEQLEQIISLIGLQKASSVQTGYGQTYRIASENTIGYGEDYSAIYFDFNKDVVSHIWLTNCTSMDKQKLLECLFEIGQKWRLLLVDWNQTTLVDLADKISIEDYLNNH